MAAKSFSTLANNKPNDVWVVTYPLSKKDARQSGILERQNIIPIARPLCSAGPNQIFIHIKSGMFNEVCNTINVS